MLLSAALDSFIASVCAGKANETPAAYRKKLKRLLVFLGNVPIESIQPADVERFRVSLLTQRVKRRGSVEVVEPLSVWYVRGVLRMVKYFFRWCAGSDLLPADVAVRVKLPKAVQVQPKAIDPATFDKLLDAAAISGDAWARSRNVAFLYLLRDTGARVSGLLTARVSDLDLQQSTLQVTEKGGKMRPVFFNETTRGALRRWLEVRSSLRVGSDALFISRYGGAFKYSGARWLLCRLAKAAGVEGERFNAHSFRHAFARDSLRAGADLSEVSQMMGHSSIVVTADSYARWLPNELQDVHRRTSPGVSMRDVLPK